MGGAEDDNKEEEGDENEIAFIAFARVYSGVLTPGQEVFVLGPKYDPTSTAELIQGGQEPPPGCHATKAVLSDLYILLGRDMEAVDRVPAGNVVGIAGLANCVLKSATLSSSPWCPAFVPVVQCSVPILRVALEPERSSDLGKLETGLQLLNQADAHVEVAISEAGEMLLATAGEVHLQRCLKDLQEEYAKCSVTVSEPIVPFRETIVIPPDTDMVNEAIEKEEDKEENDAVIMIATPNHQCTLTLRAVPLPGKLAKLLDDQQQLLRGLGSKMPTAAQEQVFSLRKQVGNLIEEVDELKGCVEKLWSLGPKRCGPNLLFNCVKDLSTGSAWGGDEGKVTSGDERAELCNAVLHGFQLATLAGPLCEEPMMGVAFLLLDWKLEANEEEGWGPLSGQIVSTMKEVAEKPSMHQTLDLWLPCTVVRSKLGQKCLGRCTQC